VLEENIRLAGERARRVRLDPQLTILEVYEAELLGRLQRRLRGQLLWKGGTVLRLEGSERFSRDLDATRRTASLSTARLKSALRELADGLAYLASTKVEVKPSSVVALYRFTVPGLRQPVRIEVEISIRERLLRPPVTVSTARLAHPSGVEPVVVSRLDDIELLAEKVRALVVRLASRDVYDTYWLLQRGVEFDPEAFLQKMDYYRRAGKPIDPVRAMERAIADLEARDPSRAKTELANLLPAAQRRLDFSVIVEDVVRRLRAWLPLVDSAIGKNLEPTKRAGRRKRPKRR
jgi:predicted nucleotidyltransferase component of viral defense system